MAEDGDYNLNAERYPPKEDAVCRRQTCFSDKRGTIPLVPNFALLKRATFSARRRVSIPKTTFLSRRCIASEPAVTASFAPIAFGALDRLASDAARCGLIRAGSGQLVQPDSGMPAPGTSGSAGLLGVHIR